MLIPPQLRLREYNRADLRTSDHRPVFAIFDATIREVDHAKKDAIAKEIMRSIRQKGSTGKMDEKIEKVMNGSPGNVGSLVNQMTKCESPMEFLMLSMTIIFSSARSVDFPCFPIDGQARGNPKIATSPKCIHCSVRKANILTTCRSSDCIRSQRSY